MALADAAKRNVRRKGPDCTVAALLARLAPDDATELRDALADPEVPSAGLWREMVALGWNPPNQQTIQRHRRGECSCG